MTWCAFMIGVESGLVPSCVIAGRGGRSGQSAVRGRVHGPGGTTRRAPDLTVGRPDADAVRPTAPTVAPMR